MRNTQPQGTAHIDTSNPIAAGLVFAMQGGTGLTEVVLGGQTTSQGSNFAVVAAPTDKAFDLRNLSAAGTINVPGATNGTNSLASDQSVVFDMVLSGAPVGSVPAIGGIWRSTAQNDALLVLERSSADGLQVGARSQGSLVNRTFAASVSSLYGTRITVGATIARGAAGRTISLVIAAAGTVLFSSSQTYGLTGSADATMSGTEYLSVGSEPVENSSRNANCLIFAQYHFARVVTADEVASLSQSPWQLFADDATAGAIVRPSAGTMSLSGYAPTVQRSAVQSAAPGAASISITGYAPQIAQSEVRSASPGIAELLISGYAPQIAQSTVRSAGPDAGVLSISGFAPSVVQSLSGSDSNVTSGAATLSLTGFAPAIAQTRNVLVTPIASAMALAGYAPTVVRSAVQTANPDTASLKIAGYAPSITQTSIPVSSMSLLPNESRTYRGMPRVRAYVAQERVREL